jgi:hypothetical protein
MDYRPTIWNRDQSPVRSYRYSRYRYRKQDEITYGTHNRSLPVELGKRTNVSVGLRHIPSHPIDAASMIDTNLLDRLPLALQSMMKEGP